MLTLLEFPLCNLTKRINNALEDVLVLLVTVVVNEEFQLVLSVLGDLVKDSQDEVLVMVVGVTWVKNLQEDLFKEDHDFLFQMLSEVQEQTVEDGQRGGEDSLLIWDWVLKQTIAKGILDYINELSSVQESVARLFDNGKDQFKT